jgi:hypothetical protein
MKMPRPTEADRTRFDALVPDDPRVEIKPMFANLAAFANGNMFMGLFGAAIGVKLEPAERAKVLEAGGGPWPPDRPMREYVTLPSSFSRARATRVVATSLALVGALPPKQRKAAKRT